MNERTLRVLEFHKIIERLSEKTATPLGKEIAEGLKPTSHFRQCVEWQQETREAKGILNREGTVPFGGIHDIRPALKRARMGAVLDPSQLLQTADTMTAARRLQKFLLDRQEGLELIPDLAERIGNFRMIEDEIHRAIIGEGEVADEASEELSRIRRHMKVLHNRVKDYLEGAIRGPMQKYLQDPIITIRGDRYVVPVKQEYRSQVPGIIHDQSASGATLFIEPMPVVNMNNELRQLKLAERDEIERILAHLSGLVSEALPELSATVDILGELDFIFAKARLALEMDASEPILNREGRLRILKGRHPLLSGNVVPIDVSLGESFHTMIITGPNTGGKTVTLKTIGLFTLMAQSGLQVPALSGTELSVFDRVHADIGDEQSIEQNLSTFSSHLTNIVRILGDITQNSLVLLDELGAGTDPTEGAALAMAILEYLHDKGVRTAATTHYSELKAFAYSRQGIENASVEFDVETLRPTYRLTVGIPGRSNAFEIATRLGLSREIIDKAKGFLTREDIKVEDLLQNIEATKRQTEAERAAAAELRRALEDLKNRYENERREWERKKNEMAHRAREEALAIVKRTKREAEDIIEHLRKVSVEMSAKERENAFREARERLRGLQEDVGGDPPLETEGEGTPITELRPGMTVFIPSINQKGIILGEVQPSGEVQVQVGIMKIFVKASSLKAIKEKEGKTPKSSLAKLMAVKAESMSTELDLRGMTVEEAYLAVDKFLDDATLAGLPQVYIIHGKGTGALRQGIREMLSKHPHVASHRLGDAGEGGSGVTVVKLK